MINKIKIHNTASYNEVVEIEPTEINYLFGSNGTGKSSLGKVIVECSKFSDCTLNWKLSEIERKAYNRDFVKHNFRASNAIKGIFTLGKNSSLDQEFVETKNLKIRQLKEQIEINNKHIDGNEIKLSEIETKAIKKTWALKVQYEDHFKSAFKGFMGSAKDFFHKCLLEKSNPSNLLDGTLILEKCKQIFSGDLKEFTEIDSLNVSDIPAYENSELLEQKIIGKEDIAFGKLIERLKNSDWLKNGINYLLITQDQCPFCQQPISEVLKTELENFFDDSYKERISELAKFVINYKTAIQELIDILNKCILIEFPYFQFEVLKSKIELVSEKYNGNVLILESKIQTPSAPVILNSLFKEFTEIAYEIEKLKTAISDNNKTIKNIKVNRKILTSEVWKFIINELEIDLKEYEKAKSSIEKAIFGLKGSNKINNDKKIQFEKEVKEKEASITSVRHTVYEINKILKLFGFTNFKLDVADQIGFYKIIRQDGSEVNETLSEGEYTFITFLYFYHLLKGSNENTGLSKDKVVIIDDPISSLDSNVLFVVSNLIKTIIQDVKDKKNNIRQIFILTHNVYFFKEVTFKGNGNNKWSEESYWVLRKPNNSTRIIQHYQNPIKTTYELLWRELDDIDKINIATVYNTMRRILEYYFNILGGLNYEKAISEFEGEEKLIFKSLVSWINDGSHFINDDLVIDAEPETISKYLKVFKEIFIKLGHKSHYDMMTKTVIVAAPILN